MTGKLANWLNGVTDQPIITQPTTNTMTNSPVDVFGLGQCALDYLGRVDEYPPPDVKCEFTDLSIQGGGPVATAMVALARWGVTCSFSGVVGDDHFGYQIRESLEREGVGTSGLLVRKRSASQFSFIVAEPHRGGRRTIYTRKPTGSPPQAEEIDYDCLRRARVFHTDGLFKEASFAAAAAARKAGIPVVVDAGSLREGMLDLAQESDYFLASEPFSSALMQKEAPLEACYRLLDMGPRVTVVTLGARGYVAVAEGKVIQRSAYSVAAVDTTGCGDVFHAGFTYGVLRGWDIEQSLDFGAWAAAQVSLRLGGRAGIPRQKDWPARFCGS